MPAVATGTIMTSHHWRMLQTAAFLFVISMPEVGQMGFGVHPHVKRISMLSP